MTRACKKSAKVVLRINPNLIVAVSGVGDLSYNGG